MLTYIADRVTTNIRELEGALTRVVAYASLTGRPISTELADEVLKDLFPRRQTPARSPSSRSRPPSASRSTSRLADLRGDKRPQSIAYPRHIAMYLCRELTDTSLPKIGAKFGGRDHSTVLHGVNKIGDLLKEDRDVFNVVQELTARIKQRPVNNLWAVGVDEPGARLPPCRRADHPRPIRWDLGRTGTRCPYLPPQPGHAGLERLLRRFSPSSPAPTSITSKVIPSKSTEQREEELSA